MPADLESPIFKDEDAAREALEATRWPDGPTCPHCGSVKRIAKLEGKTHRPGLYYCNECKGQFTVTVGTVFERSKGAAYEMVAGDAPARCEQERHERAPAAP